MSPRKNTDLSTCRIFLTRRTAGWGATALFVMYSSEASPIAFSPPLFPRRMLFLDPAKQPRVTPRPALVDDGDLNGRPASLHCFLRESGVTMLPHAITRFSGRRISPGETYVRSPPELVTHRAGSMGESALGLAAFLSALILGCDQGVGRDSGARDFCGENLLHCDVGFMIASWCISFVLLVS